MVIFGYELIEARLYAELRDLGVEDSLVSCEADDFAYGVGACALIFVKFGGGGGKYERFAVLVFHVGLRFERDGCEVEGIVCFLFGVVVGSDF